MFSDGFESGDMSQWTTSTGMSVQNQLVNDGILRGRGGGHRGSRPMLTSSSRQTWPSLYYSTRFYVVSQTSGSAYLLRLRTATKGSDRGRIRQFHRQAGVAQRCHGRTTTSSTVGLPRRLAHAWSSTAIGQRQPDLGVAGRSPGQASSPARSPSARLPSATCSSATPPRADLRRRVRRRPDRPVVHKAMTLTNGHRRPLTAASCPLERAAGRASPDSRLTPASP